ncbi:MAG: hypothetical protein M4D80_24735 [Myxococcota bacterium]|nr:hypothetical protein [Myxococcota bacterium]
MRAILIALALVACGGGAKPAPTAPEKPVAAPAPPAPTADASKELTGAIKKVRVEGAADSVRAAIETAMRDATGKPLDTDQLRGALATVMSTAGVADVTVKGVQLADGIELVVEVTMHPVMRKLTATETGGKTIGLGMSALPTGTVLDPKKVQALVASLRDRYVSNGYFDADATWRRVPTADGVEVVIEVKPGEVSSIASIAFAGNTIASKDLAAQISKLVVVGQPALDEKLRGATLVLEAYYWDRGYANVKIRPPQAAAGRLAVVFKIEEGPKFRMGSIRITGDLPAAEHAKYMKLFGVKQGDLFNRTAIADGRKRFVDALVATGKATAEVLPLTKVDLPKKTIGLTLEVSGAK